MGRITLIRCDGCGAEKPENESGSWLEIDLALVKAPETSIGKIIVDSWECLGRYAARRAEEQSPDH
jgi:hypothetical protein